MLGYRSHLMIFSALQFLCRINSYGVWIISVSRVPISEVRMVRLLCDPRQESIDCLLLILLQLATVELAGF